MEVIADQAEELQRLYAKLNRLESLKTNTMRLAAHDLRSAIGLINGYLQLIRLDVYPKLAPHEREYVDDLGKGIQRMNIILSDMLALERIDQIVDKPVTGTADLVEIAERALQSYGEQAVEKNVTLRMELVGVNRPLIIKGDAAQLLEAVANYLSNAVRSTPAGREITVRLTHQRNDLLLEVVDHGAGVSAQDQPKLFQPYRSKSAANEQSVGLGLGLYLVRNIIERHQGDVFFRETPGGGSTFGFTLRGG